VPEDEPREIQFRSDMTVELVRSSAHDSDVVFAARVSTMGEQTLEEAASGAEAGSKDKGLINFLMRDRHGSPFEHNSMTFYVQAPLFVFREFMRHRIASYNEESGRYREMRPVFYVPGPERNLVQVGKPGAYDFIAGDPSLTELAVASGKAVATFAYEEYQKQLDAGVAREVARHNVTVNNLLPGDFDTERHKSNTQALAKVQNRSYEEMRAIRIVQVAAGRFGEPSELGEYCAFLCSVQASFITGQNLLIDGGKYPGTF